MDLFIFFVLMLIFTTLENWFREVERFNPGLLNGRAGAYWHLSQLAALIITFFYVVYTRYGIEAVKTYTTLLLLGSVWFVCYDGLLNILRGLNFFRVSTQSSDPFQKFGKPIIKIILISGAFFIYYFLK
jgi:hypothetical protein